MLPFLVHKIFTFYINGVLNCKYPAPGPKVNGLLPVRTAFDPSFKLQTFYLLISILHSSITWILDVLPANFPEDYC